MRGGRWKCANVVKCQCTLVTKYLTYWHCPANENNATQLVRFISACSSSGRLIQNGRPLSLGPIRAHVLRAVPYFTLLETRIAVKFPQAAETYILVSLVCHGWDMGGPDQQASVLHGFIHPRSFWMFIVGEVAQATEVTRAKKPVQLPHILFCLSRSFLYCIRNTGT